MNYRRKLRRYERVDYGMRRRFKVQYQLGGGLDFKFWLFLGAIGFILGLIKMYG